MAPVEERGMWQVEGSSLALITAPFAQQWVERLNRLSPRLRVMWHATPNNDPVPDEVWSEVEILYTSFGTPLPAPSRVPRLRWVQLYSAGVDSVANHPLLHTAVVFTTSSGVHAICIGEYVLAVTLAWFHRLPTVFEWQRRGPWAGRAPPCNNFPQGAGGGQTTRLVGCCELRPDPAPAAP